MSESSVEPPRRSTGRALRTGLAASAAIVLLVGGALWLLVALHALPLGQRDAEARAFSARLSPLQRLGEQIYNTNCVSCHGGPFGGGMMDYPPRHNANGHTWHHPDCQITQIIREGSDAMTDAMRDMMAPPNAPRMQAFLLSDEELDEVVAYIKAMWTFEERQAQSDETRRWCSAG